MDKFKSFNIQKFDGKNFQLWKYQLEIIFRAEGISDIVNGTTKRPIKDENNDNEQKLWEEKNTKAMLIISTAMEFEQLQTVMTCEKAADMWTRLKIIHEQRSSVNKIALKQQFFNYKMNNTDTIAQHISKIESMTQALSDVDETVGEIDKIAKILGSLPAKYNGFITAWDSCDENKQTFDNLTARLLKEEQRLTQTDEVSTAFAAIKVSKPTTSNNNNIKKKNVECFYCHKKGHFKIDCRKRKEKHQSDLKNQALSAEIKNICIEGCNDIWLADSAASKHMTYKKEWFTSLQQIDCNISIQIGDNSFVKAEGIGSVKIEALIDNKWQPRTLENTLYVPNLGKNLFSVGAVTNRNFKVIFDNKKIEVRNTRLIAAGTKLPNQCYKMSFKTINVEQANIATSDSLTWHERLGHVNFQTLKNMADNGMIQNLQIKNVDNLFCESCQYGKIHRKSFKSNLKSRSEKPGEMIHTDLCGKMPITSLGGANYFLTFKDDCTSYRFVYFIKNKSDVFPVFAEFQKLIERQTGNKIKIIRSDNGKEYINHQLSEHFKDNGIVHETTSPYTPEQNGRAERENRSIVESARAMLLNTNLPQELWAEAVNTAVYLLNRRPCKSNDNKTPYELWFNKAPALQHLKIFGSLAFVHIPKQFRSKLESKSKKLVMVGYCGYSQNYRLFDIKSRKVTISRDVNFNENVTKHETENISTHIEFEWPILTKTEEIQTETTEDNAAETIEENHETVQHDNLINEDVRQLRNRNEIRPPARYCDNEFIACSAIIEEPQTFDQAVSSPESKQWYEAMKEEMLSLEKNNTWKLVPLPNNRKPIGCKWVYRIKQKPNGKIDRYKARLCAKGYSQQHGIDYKETFSPVIRYDSIRVLLAIAAVNNMEIKQFDVKTAFLYGNLNEEVYMQQPDGFTIDNSTFVCKLNKSIYGLKQSPRCWNLKFTNFLTTFGFKQLNTDRCVFYTRVSNTDVYLALYVDDGLILCESTDIIEEILSTLSSCFDITISDGTYFCGLEIQRNREKREIFISQCGYINRILQKFNMNDCKSKSVPCVPGNPLHNGQCPTSTEEKKEMSNRPYREAVGSLMFTAIVSRPDIMYAVSQVSRFLNNPGSEHWSAVKRIFQYLQGTKDIGIKYQADHLSLTMYSDADFAGDIDTRRSTTGYVSLLANGPVTWSSHRQKCVTRSTTEAEYIAASDAAAEAIWLRNFLKEVNSTVNGTTHLYVDNQSAIKLVENVEPHKRTKHIDVKYHFIRELVNEKMLEISYICSEKQLADIFTKALSRDKFLNNRQSLSIMFN